MHRLIASLAILICTTSTALARPLWSAELMSLDAVVQRFIDDIEQKDMAGVVNVVPARIINHYSGIMEMSPDQFRNLMVAQMSETMRPVTIQFIKIELMGLDVTEAKTAVDEGVLFARLPYSMQMTLNGKEVQASSALIALFEDNEWGLIRIEPNQITLLIEIYPFLKDVGL